MKFSFIVWNKTINMYLNKMDSNNRKMKNHPSSPFEDPINKHAQENAIIEFETRLYNSLH